jgi:hypothetical protein
VRYENQPVERRTQPADGLRVVIGQVFSLVQSAALECAKVSAAVWEESGKVGGNALVKVLPISMDATKLPALLMRPASALALPGLGGTGGGSAPARAACPYCEAVAELVEDYGPGLLYRYRCPNADCGYESSYSPAQAAAWMAKHPIRKDGRKLTMPDGDFYKALASYRDGERFVALVWSDKLYETGLKTVSPVGDVVSLPFRCRPINGIERARAVLKTWLADKPDVEYHDAAMHSAEAIPLWAAPPTVLTTVEELRKLFDGEFGWRPSSVKILTTEGKRFEPYRVRMVRDDAIEGQGMALALDDIARVEGTGNPEDHSTAYPEPTFPLYEKPGWTPPVKPAKKAKAKKGAVPPEEAEADKPEGASEE